MFPAYFPEINSFVVYLKICAGWFHIVQIVNHHSATPELKVQSRQMD